MPEMRLLKDYVCDVEWWIAYPADPRFTYHDAGEVYWATDDEAKQMLDDGVAVLASLGGGDDGGG